MIIVNTNNAALNVNKIINLNGANLTPRVISKRKILDQFGNEDTLLKIEFFCQVDVQKAKNTSTYESIQVMLSRKNLNYYAKIASSSSVLNELKKQELSLQKNSNVSKALAGATAMNPSGDNTKGLGNSGQSNSNASYDDNNLKIASSPLQQNNSLSIGQLNKSLTLAGKHRIVKNANLYKGAIDIGFINVANVKKMPTTENISTVVNSSQSRNNARLLTLDNAINAGLGIQLLQPGSKNKKIATESLATVFAKAYHDMQEENKDPASLFQNSYGKTSAKQDRKGLGKPRQNGDVSKKYEQIFHKTYNSIIENIAKVTEDFNEVEITTVQKPLQRASVIVDLNLKNLKKLGNNFNVLLFGKKSNGQKIESGEYIVKLQDILSQLNMSATQYSLNSTRSGGGVSILKVSNTEKTRARNLNVFVEAKATQRNPPNKYVFYKPVNTVSQLPPKAELTFRDGKYQSRAKNPTVFSPCQSIIYRALLGYRRKKYFNFKTTVDSSKIIKNENTPFCTVIAKNQLAGSKASGINIFITNISENIAAVRPVKYKFKGNSRSMRTTSTFDRRGEKNKFTFLQGATSAMFVDIDVKQDKSYMYLIECLMKNGERKIIPKSFTIKYKKRTDTVHIDNISLVSQTGPSASEEILGLGDDANLNTRHIDISFKIEKINLDVEVILSSMFGDLFDLYRDKLAKIRDIQNLIYSVEIVRINNFTGNSATIGKVTPDKDGICKFTDNNAPYYNSCTYQFLPRVMLASEAIEEVTSQVEMMSQKFKNGPINYSFASQPIKNQKKISNVMHESKGKFQRRNNFKKGLIENEKVLLDRKNFDLFFDASTGDVFEKSISNIDPQNIPGDNLLVKNAKITRMTSDLANLDYNRDKNTINEEYYDLTFSVTSDVYVDFYAIFVKEGKHVYLDGVMHSTDTITQLKKYCYLMKHVGSQGIVEYHIVPFYKNGTIGSPKLIAAQSLD